MTTVANPFACRVKSLSPPRTPRAQRTIGFVRRSRLLGGEKLLALLREASMTNHVRQRALWVLWTVMFVASLGAVVALNRSTVGTPVRAATGDGSSGMGSAWRNPPSGAASTSCIRRRHSMPASSTSCRRWRRWGRRSPSPTSTATAGRIFYVTNSGEGALNRLYRNKGDGTFVDVARPSWGLRT